MKANGEGVISSDTGEGVAIGSGVKVSCEGVKANGEGVISSGTGEGVAIGSGVKVSCEGVKANGEGVISSGMSSAYMGGASSPKRGAMSITSSNALTNLAAKIKTNTTIKRVIFHSIDVVGCGISCSLS